MQPRIERRDPLLGPAPARRGEVVDRSDLGQALSQSSEVGLGAGAALPRRRPALRQLSLQTVRLVRDLAVVGIARLMKETHHLFIGETFDEPGLANRGIAAAGGDLPQDPLEILHSLIPAWQHVHRVLDRHRAQALEPAPDLHPEVIGLRRDLMDQQQPLRLGRPWHRSSDSIESLE